MLHSDLEACICNPALHGSSNTIMKLWWNYSENQNVLFELLVQERIPTSIVILIFLFSFQENDVFPIPDLGHTRCKHPTEFFCKILTASDTSTHGGYSVPRRAAEKLFPQLVRSWLIFCWLSIGHAFKLAYISQDYSMQPPNQELIVRDLHDNLWTFRHIYRGRSIGIFWFTITTMLL